MKKLLLRRTLLRVGGCALLSAATTLAVGAFPTTALAQAGLSPSELAALVQAIDERQRNQGDWHSRLYMEQKEKGKLDIVYQTEVYRRSSDNKFVILFTRPKVTEGQGYLRIDRNLWFYDPSVGRWERRTERERIGGTNSRRSDFDESTLAKDYDPAYDGEEALGAYTVHALTLRAKASSDTAFPVIKVWVDKENGNVLKRQEYALSGRLLRTSYYPKWKKLYSESKKGDVWYPEEIRLYDEVEKGSSTLIVVQGVELAPLPSNLFTKGWLESKSR
jgi:outer membrane lipoprotein-sorting protein